MNEAPAPPVAPAPRKIAILDLFARPDGFQGDGSLQALSALLIGKGHDVRLLRSVLASDAQNDSPRWFGMLGKYLRENQFHVVVLPRAWDVDLIGALREALPQAQFVRLAGGTRAQIDDKFDHVLDVNGLLGLLAGEAAPAPSSWTRLTARDLREKDVGLLRITTAPTVAYVSLPGSGTEARPTMSGPTTGCPFLLDSRKLPLYRDLAVDDSQVQMKGCTFCLDNIGTYVAPSEEAMVGAWMSQLRGVRRAVGNTSRLEVLCTDERPHPYLPALFRALNTERDVAPFEILIKTRVDWLLEFADTALAEACTLAEKCDSILHIYLVGFENFDQSHLDLFNKGVTVADNVAAIAKLAELKARFPRSFEYRHYRAHGIVLFTPWTRPEHLLENARMMREVRFHELRSEALRTRLRLYPRVPLHALAARDGLLVEAFEEGRSDRAAEQGYDASVPWKFQDPRVESIFRLSNQQIVRRRHITDADMLEAATHFILRWNGLVAAPDVAHLPFEQAMRVWTPPLEEGVSAATLGFDPEIELIVAGHKDACLKEAVRAASAAGLCEAYRAMGLFADVVWTHGMSESGDVHEGGGDNFAIVAVAKDEATLAQVVTAQRAHRQRAGQMIDGGGEADVAREMGRLMGYPDCCVAAFLKQRERGNNLENERLAFRRAHTEALHPALNRFGALRLLSHHPCSPSCAPSVALAEAVLACLERLDPEAGSFAREQLRQPVLLLDFGRRIRLQGGWEGDRFLVERATPLDDDHRLGVPLERLAAVEVSPTAATFHYRATDATGAATSLRVEVRAPLLVTPGASLAPAALAAIGGPAGSSTHDAELPAAMHTGALVLGYKILSIRRVSDGGKGVAHRIELGAASDHFALRLRAHDPERRSALRRGAWAIDIEGSTALPERARAAIVVLARALPAT